MMVPSNREKRELAEKIKADMDAFLQHGGRIAQYGAGQARLDTQYLLTSYNNNYSKDPDKKRRHKAAAERRATIFNKRGVERDEQTD